MKKRIIFGSIYLAIFIPSLLLGGVYFTLFVYSISLLGLNELLRVREKKHIIKPSIKFISYVFLTLLIFGDPNLGFVLDYRLFSSIILGLVLPVLFYKSEEYSINDAFFMIGILLFLGIVFNLLLSVRAYSLNIMLYLLIIAMISDTYAYLTGNLLGKNKLIPSISPKKTIEGLVGGTVFGVLFGVVYYMTVINSSIALFDIVLLSLFLSIVGQIGDLIMSSFKRYYGVKDFSNLLPGHGGVLDRFDSIIFILLAYTLIMNFI
jgi:phosphatidate cytidylyltransferase